MKTTKSIDELKVICQSDKLLKNRGWTLANRKVSLHISRLLIRFGVTANQASVISIFTGVVAGLCFISGTFIMNILAILLLYISLTMDQVDGELARYHGTVSLNGVYLDEIRHLLIYAIPLFFLAFAPSKHLNCLHIQIFGFVAALVVNLIRVEERLPLLIYTDRILLKNNFTKGKFCSGGEDQVIEEHGEGMCSSIKTKVKLITKPIYYIYSIMADQVSILFFLLIVTLGDFLLLKYYDVQLVLQTFFIVSFSCFGSFIFLRTFFVHWSESWAVEMCREISKKQGCGHEE